MLENFEVVKSEQLPLIVVAKPQVERELVLGYAYTTRYIPEKRGYRHTFEISVYVLPDQRRSGVGSMLMGALMERLKTPIALRFPPEANSEEPYKLPQAEITQALAIMSLDEVDDSNGGYGLRDWYAQWEFKEVGHLEKVGFKFGRWIDTLILQASLA